MWKCPKCGLMQRIDYKCKKCGKKFPQIKADVLKNFRKFKSPQGHWKKEKK